MEYTTRQNKVSRLIQKELGDIFIREATNLFKGLMVTITMVRITADLSIAKVYLSVFPSGEGKNVLTTLAHFNKNIRHQLASRIRHQLKSIPEIQFFIDDSLDYAESIDELLKK